ncbi:MAG: hypothetical protein WC549_00530 [Actinomycetota bacterium]
MAHRGYNPAPTTRGNISVPLKNQPIGNTPSMEAPDTTVSGRGQDIPNPGISATPNERAGQAEASFPSTGGRSADLPKGGL